MISLIKFTIYFTISFLILSFPIGNRTIFYHLGHYTRPFTELLYANIRKTLKEKLTIGQQAAKEIHKKAIQNIPNAVTESEEVLKELRKINIEDLEEISEEEREALKRILSQSKY